jgi:hypothetical protein
MTWTGIRNGAKHCLRAIYQLWASAPIKSRPLSTRACIITPPTMLWQVNSKERKQWLIFNALVTSVVNRQPLICASVSPRSHGGQAIRPAPAIIALGTKRGTFKQTWTPSQKAVGQIEGKINILLAQ